MTEITQKKEDVKMHLKDLRLDLKKMHLSVTEELLLLNQMRLNHSCIKWISF